MFPDHRKSGRLYGLVLGGFLFTASVFVQAQAQNIRIGVPTPLQLQVGRDTVDSMQIAVDDQPFTAYGTLWWRREGSAAAAK